MTRSAWRHRSPVRWAREVLGRLGYTTAPTGQRRRLRVRVDLERYFRPSRDGPTDRILSAVLRPGFLVPHQPGRWWSLSYDDCRPRARDAHRRPTDSAWSTSSSTRRAADPLQQSRPRRRTRRRAGLPDWQLLPAAAEPTRHSSARPIRPGSSRRRTCARPGAGPGRVRPASSRGGGGLSRLAGVLQCGPWTSPNACLP
jgi:hypothetical protein